METKHFELDINAKKLIVEIRDWAEQANGNVLVRYGDTLILGTAVMSKNERTGLNFFPLTVDYEEKFYAAGKILGSRFIRRESRPSDEAIITARLIDRTIRPLFPKGLSRDVQTIITCLSWDKENDSDIPGLLSVSLALSISDIPWSGPVSAVRIGRIEKKFIVNPSYQEREKSDLDLVLTAVLDDEKSLLFNMIESEADELDEKIILEAISFAKPHLEKLLAFQEQIIKQAGKQKIVPEIANQDPELEKEMNEFLADRPEKALYQEKKENRSEELSRLEEELAAFIEERHPGGSKTKYAKDFFQKELEKIFHQNTILKKTRPDGRKLDEIREIDCQAGLLPRTHGSGLFIRGITKALSILTLGAPGDQRLLEGMEFIGKKRFMHHYNFPPYCSGEVKPLRGPGRREIGHGLLAEKAILPLIPTFEEFPYTIRVVTEILSSNGSTSMAAISSSCLALMDAGVPIKAAVAGISIGLAAETDEKQKIKNYKLLTDIQGPEDHYGDMDFKVAGTENGITAIQMDVKIRGITEKILEEALFEGKKTRFHILEKMKAVLAGPKPELSPFAPRVFTVQINPEKIREVIGPGGKVINEIIDKCEVEIDVEPSGLIFVTAEKEAAAKKAVSWIKNITREVKVGEVFEGKVKRILDFGAFVEIIPGQEGLVHISQLAPYRVRKVQDVVKIGDIVPVKVISVDEQGRINLSIKEAKNIK